MESFDVSTSRLLGGGGGPIELDYTIFAMAVLTMGLLLIVEVIRHGVDRMARGHDFFESVLNTVYHELSTLGIVEAAVFLLNQFFEVNLEKERIFADVHFTLFFVAIINALMACIIYILAMIVAHQRWVKMETLDLEMYVAIRQEFDQVQAQLKALQKRAKANKDGNSNSNHTTSSDSSSFEQDWSQQNNPNNTTNNKNKNLVSVIGTIMENPTALRLGQHGTLIGILEKKYAGLLVQIRFHDMRVHFIETHSLPSNFRISDYLRLAMNDAFKEFVHVSTRTWLTLMGCANFIYFTMGMITYAASSTSSSSSSSSYDYNEIVPIALSWIFIGYCIFFVVVSFLISIKMDAIFKQIIAKDSWIQVDSSLVSKPGFFARGLIGTSWSTSKGSLSINDKSQKDQFWFRKPDLIITFAQLMQFGFSVGFAILLIFQKTVRSGNVFDWWGWYFVAPVICFLIFIWLWSIIIPQYTQCTNLGELVSKRHLIEIEATSQLEEEHRRRQEQIDLVLAEKDLKERMTKKSKKSPSKDKGKRVRIRTISAKSADGMFSDETLEQISEFVKNPTKELPAVPTKKKIENNEKEEIDIDDASVAGFEIKARNFFLSHTYRQGSAVFGTLIALYLLSLRIQLMLIQTCSMKDQDIIWLLAMNEPHSVFWLVVGWFCFFIFESLVVLVLFGRDKDRKNFYMVIAGLFDILITSAAIGIFLLAEFNRCCTCDTGDYESVAPISSKNIFRASTDDYQTTSSELSTSCTINSDLSCCPPFGTRLCGGIGTIEPFSALFGLRLLRFFVADMIVRHEESSNEKDSGNFSHDEHHEDDLWQKTAELWIMALSKYTDIAKKHGIFSANLLESMLGIEPVPNLESKHGKEQMETSMKSKVSFDVSERSQTFERPNSKLIRSMRRCAFKWYPLLNNKWQLVDVVLSEHEIVWFDVKVNLLQLSSDEKEALYSIKDKMVDNGGVGLRLNEVAIGRTILGRVSLSDLEHVIVQKVSQEYEITKNADCDIEQTGETPSFKKEYWTSALLNEESILSHDDIEKCFDFHNCTKRLKLQSNHGTLYLQFIVDKILSEVKILPDKPREDIFLVWCKTIRANALAHNFGSRKLFVETVAGNNLDDDDDDDTHLTKRNILQRIVSGRSSRNLFL